MMVRYTFTTIIRLTIHLSDGLNTTKDRSPEANHSSKFGTLTITAFMSTVQYYFCHLNRWYNSLIHLHCGWRQKWKQIVWVSEISAIPETVMTERTVYFKLEGSYSFEKPFEVSLSAHKIWKDTEEQKCLTYFGADGSYALWCTGTRIYSCISHAKISISSDINAVSQAVVVTSVRVKKIWKR